MILDAALAADRRREYVAAVRLYQEAMSKEPHDLEALLDFAGICWRVSDPGLIAAVGLSDDFVNEAGSKIRMILDVAGAEFPGDTRPEFWSKYIWWASYGGDFSVDDCQRIYSKDPSQLTPVLFLASMPDGKRWEAEARMLQRQHMPRGTTLSQYVVSVLDSLFVQWF